MVNLGPRLKALVILLLLCLVVLLSFTRVEIYFSLPDIQNRGEQPSLHQQYQPTPRGGRKFVVLGKSRSVPFIKGALNSNGFQEANNYSDPNLTLLWKASPVEGSFIQLVMDAMRPYQRINYVPGCDTTILSKVALATSGRTNVTPKAFQLPDGADDFLEYSKKNPEKMFLLKPTTHDVVKMQKVSDMDLDDAGSFVQEYMEKPLLLEGRRCDIAIYVIVPSIDPLRFYLYEEEVRLQVCKEPYFPFDMDNIDKYIVDQEDERILELPFFAQKINSEGMTRRAAFDEYLKSKGKQPDKMWKQVEAVIMEVMMKTRQEIKDATSGHPHLSKSFFGLLRFDFLIDDQLGLALLEVQEDKNLNEYLKTLLPNVLKFSGVMQDLTLPKEKLAINSKECQADYCWKRANACADVKCALCSHCLTPDDVHHLSSAVWEKQNKQALWRRLYPAPVDRRRSDLYLQTRTQPGQQEDLMSMNNLKMHRWFWHKCLEDQQWCI